MRCVGSAFVIVAALAGGCGQQHRSMEDAVLYAVCGDRCKNVTVELSEVRRAGDYATADVRVKPAGRVEAAHYLLHQVHGDWASVDAWTSLGGLTCAEVGRQMRVPEPILHRLAVC